MNLFRDINRRFLWTATILISCLCIVSFLAAWSRDDGTLGDSMILNFLADVFMVLRFPFHPLLSPIMNLLQEVVMTDFVGLLFILGIFGNCFLYAFILERIYHFKIYNRRTKAKPESGA